MSGDYEVTGGFADQDAVEVRPAAALTGAYVISNEVDISEVRNFELVSVFRAGVHGAINLWLPYVQIEYSWRTSGDNWAYMNVQAPQPDGTVPHARGVWMPNQGVAYAVHGAVYKDVFAGFMNQGSWKRLRIRAMESQAPTNQGTLQVLVVPGI